MYSKLPSFVFGFHGCDRTVGEKVLYGDVPMNPSTNDYDWLGHGIYFWESNPFRAYEFAGDLVKNPRIKKQSIKEPFVIGAVIDLGRCLNLIETRSLELVRKAYEALKELSEKEGNPMPKDQRSIKTGEDLLIRKLDCAVIETLHAMNDEFGFDPYDSVRGVFWEGEDLYPDAGFKEKNHIQICVRNIACIKGYFRPLVEMK